MPKLNSIELKHKRKILNWAGENWHSLTQNNKVKCWCALLSKELPTRLQGPGEDGEIIIKIQKDEIDGNYLQAPRFAIPNIQ